MVQKTIKQLGVSQREYLLSLGLSEDAVELYALLLRYGELTAQAAATHNHQFPSAQYRLFYMLEESGLIIRTARRPKRYQALSPDSALPAAQAQHSARLKQLLAKSIVNTGNDVVHVRLVVGREALYAEYVRQAEKAGQEICVYAIGIAYSEELLATQRSALQRGVSVRHVVQQIQPANYHVVHKWQRLGVQLRFAPAERGFHVMVFDGKVALVSFSDPTNTDERFSIVTDSPAAAKLFYSNFQDIWNEAREVQV